MSDIVPFPPRRETACAERAKPGKRTQPEVAKWLSSAGFIQAAWFSSNHVKVGAINFYVSTGRIHWDNQPAEPERWLAGLRTVLETVSRRSLPPTP